LIPGLADRAPIKKWAAFAALVVTGFYLVLSGNQVGVMNFQPLNCVASMV